MKTLEHQFDRITSEELKNSLWQYTFKNQTTALLQGDKVEGEGDKRKVKFLGIFADDEGISRSSFEAINPAQYDKYTRLPRDAAAKEVLRLNSAGSRKGAQLAFPIFVEAYHKAYDHLDDPDF